MTEVDQFLAEVLPRQLEADRALQNGDPTLRHRNWSDAEPLTLFGAWYTASTPEAVHSAFDDLAAQFSDSVSFDIEVLAAGVDGDLAYMVCYEHSAMAIDGRPRRFSIRVTHVYRRESGVWRIVHRHGDFAPLAPGTTPDAG